MIWRHSFEGNAASSAERKHKLSATVLRNFAASISGQRVKPSALSKAAFAGLAISLALALAGCVGETLDDGPIDAHAARALAGVHLDPSAAAAALNAYRASKGLGPVRLDPALCAMAQRQADAMVAGNKMSHDIAGSFTSRLAGSGVDTTEAGENLGGGYYSLEEAMTGWRNSPEHNANLLIPNASRLGIAIAKDAGSHFGVYWAMELAAPPRVAAAASTLLTSTSLDPVEAH